MEESAEQSASVAEKSEPPHASDTPVSPASAAGAARPFTAATRATSSGKAPSTRRAARPTRSQIATQQTIASRREREEWDRTRGAGSSVLLWYEQLRLQPSSSTALQHFGWTAAEVSLPADEAFARHHEPMEVVGMDRLLEWGLCDYTILPRTLGRGRFSTVYLAIKNGAKYAVKHTPLFPHHELVATRLLREPRLLAELPAHPNLVAVVETIRTPGHFYLVEEFLEGYITLESLISRLSQASPPVLPLDVAERVFDQLVLALHAIHGPLRVCHRDVKPENVLVHPETLQLKLLDFGLATHFSKSHPKLTTCCGSPAFHCPEIVAALSQPPGTMSYWGPEVDAWTCGVTLLRCLSGIRYPLGTSHTSPASMGSRARRVLALLPASKLRDNVARLLDVNGERRMAHLAELGEQLVASKKYPYESTRRELKSTSFMPTQPQHTMALPLVLKEPVTPGVEAHLTLLNPSRQPSLRILSFVRYCLRCAGILYYALPKDSDPLRHASGTESPRRESPNSCTFQCVVELVPDDVPSVLSQVVHSVLSLFGSPPPGVNAKLPQRACEPARDGDDTVQPSSGPSGRQGPLRMLVFYLCVQFPRGADTPLASDSTVPPDALAMQLDRHLRRTRQEGVSSAEPRMDRRTRADHLTMEARYKPWSPESVATSSPRTRRSASRAASRPSAVHVLVSDARAVPYLRGALGNGGVLREPKHEDEGLYSSISCPTTVSGRMTPRDEREGPNLIGPHELVASLDAIESACRALLVHRTTDGRVGTDAVRARQLYALVLRLRRRLEDALSAPEHSEALRGQMAELNFRALDVLSPLLALVGERDTKSGHATADTNTGSMALSVLNLFVECSSSKEMCLGFQEQIERLSCAWLALEEGSEDVTAILARTPALLVQAVLGQLQLLSDALPSVQTRKPRALLEPVLELLYPHLYCDVISEALACIDGDVREELATQAAVLLCELCLGMAAWLPSTATDAPDVGAVLIDGLHAIFTFLPHADAPTDVSPRITVWNLVRKTFDRLALDLGSRCLAPSRGARVPFNAAHAGHALVLFVELLSYEKLMAQIKRRSRNRVRVTVLSATTIGEPSRWSVDVARELLTRLAPALPNALLAELGPLDVPASLPTLAAIGDAALCRALIQLTTWCMDALDSQSLLEDKVATYVIRALACVATYSADPSVRSRAFDQVVRLLRDAASDEVVLRLVREMMAPEAPPPLRGASVHAVREICAARLQRLYAGKVQADALFADGRLWRVWNGALFALPSGAPQPDEQEDTLAQLDTYLTHHQTYLQECCSLYYFVCIRDAERDYTGMRDELVQARLTEHFFRPLNAWVQSWLTFCHEHTHSASVTVQLALLDSALSRIREHDDW